MPGRFQQHALLWIREFRLHGTDAEEFGIEVERLVDQADSPDITGILAQFGRHAGIELVIAQERDGFLACSQVRPEFVHIPGSRKPARHTHYRDIARLSVCFQRALNEGVRPNGVHSCLPSVRFFSHRADGLYAWTFGKSRMAIAILARISAFFRDVIDCEDFSLASHVHVLQIALAGACGQRMLRR
jgi:hypothetical protein